jgi:hypothetical protein
MPTPRRVNSETESGEQQVNSACHGRVGNLRIGCMVFGPKAQGFGACVSMAMMPDEGLLAERWTTLNSPTSSPAASVT